jgi:hypothetical protein
MMVWVSCSWLLMDTFALQIQTFQPGRYFCCGCASCASCAKKKSSFVMLVFGFTYGSWMWKGASILLLRKQARRKVVSSCMVGASSKQQTANSKVVLK